MKNTTYTKTKKANSKWQHIKAYGLIYLSIGLLMIVFNYYTDQLDFLNETNTVFIDPSDFDQDFTAHNLEGEGDQVIDFSIDLPKEAFNALDGDEYTLIVNGVQDNAIKVWFNDHLVISVGDIINGHSMIKGGSVSGPIEASELRSKNVVRIQTYAVYKSGTEDQVVITEKLSGERAVKLLNFFEERVLLLGIGFIVMAMFFVLIIYLLNRKGNVILLFLCISTYCISIYFVDFFKINFLFFDYLLIKKLLLFNLALGVLFYGLAIYSVLQRKYIMILPVGQLLYFMVVLLISGTMIEFKTYYNYWYIGIGLSLVQFLFSATVNIRKNNRSFVIFLHLLVLLVFGATSLYVSAEKGYFSLTTPVLFMITVAMLPLIISLELFLEKDLRVIREKELKNVAYTQSMTDDLTGVWNKRYLEQRLYELIDNAVVALIDLDNLKTINDTYGHLGGDAVLCQVTDTIRHNVRQGDDICRYGGDEFVVIFEKCNLDYAVHIVEKIRKLIEQTPISFDGTELVTSVSIGLCEVSDTYIGDEIIECADRRLYQAKEKGKNRTEFA